MKMKSLLLMKEFLIKQNNYSAGIQQVNINQSLIQRLVGFMSWTSILPVALKRRANKGTFTPLAIVLKARLLDNEKKKVVLYPGKPLGSENMRNRHL
jgi:hypothetical protein